MYRNLRLKNKFCLTLTALWLILVTMPKDAFTIYRCVGELKSLVGGHIDKINMPDKETVVLTVRANKRNEKLVLSCAGQSARIHLTSSEFENPVVAFGILMHFRKHIQGGVIQDIFASPAERIVELDILSYDDLKNRAEFRLILELTGKTSNLILVDREGKISDSVKRIPLDALNAERVIFPSFPYLPPPAQERVDIYSVDTLIDLTSRLQPITTYDALRKCVAGLAPATIDEGFYRASLDKNKTLCNEDIISFCNALKDMYDYPLSPTVTVLDGKAKDYYAFPYHDAAGDARLFESLNSALDFYYSYQAQRNRWLQLSKPLFNTLKSSKNKALKRAADFEQKRLDCSDLERDRLFGELITANIYRIKRSDSCVTVDNYYTGGTENIPLDPMINAQSNAAAYFKKYNKKKRALSITEKMLADTRVLIDNLERIDDAFRLCSTTAELTEIENELVALKLISTPKKKRKSSIPSKPAEFNISGFKVLVGKNNAQNDRITRAAKPDDIWLHSAKIHGSHVIISSQGKTVPQDVIIKAAAKAAFYSKAYMADKVAVDYTTAQNVHFERNSALGKVVYDNYKTVIVKPDAPDNVN